MRSGFSVCAKACRCHALLPRKLRFSITFNCRLATLDNFDTFAEYCQFSPSRIGEFASGRAVAFLASLGETREAGVGAALLAFSGCAARFPAAGAGAGAGIGLGPIVDAGETSSRFCTCYSNVGP